MSPAHSYQSCSTFFKTPQNPETRFIYLVLVTTSSNFTSSTPQTVSAQTHGAFLSVLSANLSAASWLLREYNRQGLINEDERDISEGSKNMKNGFWVPDNASEAKEIVGEGDEMGFHIFIGEGEGRTVYEIKVVEERLNWELDVDEPETEY